MKLNIYSYLWQQLYYFGCCCYYIVKAKRTGSPSPFYSSIFTWPVQSLMIYIYIFRWQFSSSNSTVWQRELALRDFVSQDTSWGKLYAINATRFMLTHLTKTWCHEHKVFCVLKRLPGHLICLYKCSASWPTSISRNVVMHALVTSYFLTSSLHQERLLGVLGGHGSSGETFLFIWIQS